jgi:hypothetical protein
VAGTPSSDFDIVPLCGIGFNPISKSTTGFFNLRNLKGQRETLADVNQANLI